jgi:hypothetical protein
MLFIIGYVFNGMPERVLQMVGRISVQPDGVIATILVNACDEVAAPHAVKVGKTVPSQLQAGFFDNHILINSATDMMMNLAR